MGRKVKWFECSVEEEKMCSEGSKSKGIDGNRVDI